MLIITVALKDYISLYFNQISKGLLLCVGWLLQNVPN